MGLINKLKQAFGLGNSELEYEEDTYAIDATVKPLHSHSRNEQQQQANVQSPATQSVDELPAATMPEVPLDSIFNSVVEEFNRAMPSFMATGVNAEAQRKHLYSLLDTDVKAYMENVRQNAMEDSARQREKEHLKLNQELSSLKERLKTIEENEAEKARQLLSAERQKRALNERIHDLESQVANLEAEKDQYELETRSLVNKLRVCNMLNEGTEVPDVATYEARITELQGQIDALTVKTDMSDVMFNDLNERAARANKEIADKEAEILSLNDKLKDALQEVDNTRAELDEARADLEIASELESKIDEIQEAIQTKNNQITELSLKLRQREDRITALEAEQTTLQKSIEENLKSRTESEKALREDIGRLEQQLQTVPYKEKSRKPRKQQPKISAIDEELDNTDWLVATPPEGTPIKTSGVSDAEFGYQEPQRKNPPENSAQMSLW